MADMEDRLALNYLLDFYGPLLTEHRQELMRLYCEEDLSLQEIADQMAITRQGVSDALAKARRQLEGFEQKLGLVARYRRQSAEAQACLLALERVHPAPQDEPALAQAREALRRMLEE